jgi:4a-hydroxytetrahydrobiopterin dehydratase
MSALKPEHVSRLMKTVPKWGRRSRTIWRKFEFEGFMDSIEFVKRVARKAEDNDHHPDIDIRWNKVTLTLSTHSEGGLTQKDFSMARQCSEIFSRHFGHP